MKKEHLFLEDQIYQVNEEDKNGRVTISRTSKGQVEITIRDNTSRISFAKCILTPHQFAEAITGLSETPCVLETTGLENVGKSKEVYQKVFLIPEGQRFEDVVNDVKQNYRQMVTDTLGTWKLEEYFNQRSQEFSDEKGKKFVMVKYVRYV